MKKAADEKSPLAQTFTGDLYERGIGTEKDDNKALHYYLLAAQQDEPRAKAKVAALKKIKLTEKPPL